MPIYRVRTVNNIVREFIVDAADRADATTQVTNYPENQSTVIQLHMDTDHTVSIADATKQDWVDELRNKEGT